MILVILRFFGRNLVGYILRPSFSINEIRNSVEYWGAGNKNPPFFDVKSVADGCHTISDLSLKVQM